MTKCISIVSILVSAAILCTFSYGEECTSDEIMSAQEGLTSLTSVTGVASCMLQLTTTSTTGNNTTAFNVTAEMCELTACANLIQYYSQIPVPECTVSGVSLADGVAASYLGYVKTWEEVCGKTTGISDNDDGKAEPLGESGDYNRQAPITGTTLMMFIISLLTIHA